MRGNFFITPTGLEAQLLGRLVAKERRDLEEEKQALTESNAAMAHGLKQLQVRWGWAYETLPLAGWEW